MMCVHPSPDAAWGGTERTMLVDWLNWGGKQETGQANGAYKHGNRRLVELRRVLKTFATAAGTFTALKAIEPHFTS